MIKPIQPILIVVAITTAFVFYRRLRSRVLDRSLIVVATVSGVVLVSFPELSKVLANYLGVGRGVDLVFYVGLVVLGFLWLELAARQRQTEDTLTEIVRSFALLKAEKPQDDTTNPPGDSERPHDP